MHDNDFDPNQDEIEEFSDTELGRIQGGVASSIADKTASRSKHSYKKSDYFVADSFSFSVEREMK